MFQSAPGVSCPEIGLHIKCKQMDKKKQSQIIHDHALNGLSYRNLGKKYGIDHNQAYRMIMSNKRKQANSEASHPEAAEDNLPDDVKLLKEEIRRLKLKVELQDIIIDISSKELGVDLRKKRGTRRS